MLNATRTGKTTRRLLTGAGICLSTVLIGCGGGDDEASAEQVAAFCELYETTDRSDSPPTDDELDRLDELVPAEISDEMTTVTDAIRAAIDDGTVGDQETIESAGEAIQSWAEENCTP